MRARTPDLTEIIMSNKTSFYLLTDTHFVSKNAWVEGKPFTLRERGDQIAMKLSPEILDSFIEKILADSETDTVIFTGDNVNNGDMVSHYDFREKLERLVSAGKKVCVTTATHDYCGMDDDENFFKACRYTETGTEPAECMRKAGLFDFYEKYGPAQALSVHRESGSYIVRVGEKTRLAMINDNGNGRSHCGLFEDGFNWLREQVADANASGEYMLFAVHHPVIAPWELYRKAVEFELYGGYKELSEFMCAEKVRAVFTGHVHVQNIRKYESENGGYFYDIATIAAVNAAGKMRKVTVDEENGICKVESTGIEKISGFDTGDLSARDYLYGINLPGFAEKLLPLALTDYEKFLELGEGVLPVDKLKKHKFLVRFAVKKFYKMTVYTAAKLGKIKKKLTAEQKEYAKNTPLSKTAFTVFAHVFPGDAPYTPDTVENIALTAAAKRLDRLVSRFKISAVQNLIPEGSSLADMLQDFLYNNRTGSDDEIEINLN